MFSSRQMHKKICFICYHLESGWHATIPNQGLSLGRRKSLGTRLPVRIYRKCSGTQDKCELYSLAQFLVRSKRKKKENERKKTNKQQVHVASCLVKIIQYTLEYAKTSNI